MNEILLIKHSIVHTLNYMVIELMRRAYQLAMTDELKGLDGLIDTRLDNWMHSDENELIGLDDDIDLLSSVDDPGVKIVLDSIIKILDKNKIFQMLQNVDLEDAMLDNEATQEASGILRTYILELRTADNYKNILSDLEVCYTSISIIIYHCVMMLDMESTEVWEEGMNSWTAQGDDNDYIPKNSSGALLLDLNVDLMKDALRLSDHLYGT